MAQYGPPMLPVVLHGCETWSVTMRKETPVHCTKTTTDNTHLFSTSVVVALLSDNTNRQFILLQSKTHSR